MAFLLKSFCGHDAIAMGWRLTSPETQELLYRWADHVIIMQLQFEEKVPEQYRSKVKVCDVGEDRYFHPDHDLLQICGSFIEAEGLLKR